MMTTPKNGKSAYQLMMAWGGLFPSEAVRVNGNWIDCSITGRGVHMFASPAQAKAYVLKTSERVSRARNKAA